MGTKGIFGYRYDRNERNYIVVSFQARLVREIFERYLAGWSLNAIAIDMNRRRIATPRGGSQWFHKSIAAILDNPIYAGYRRYEGKLYPATWKRIVSVETWKRTQQRRAERVGYSSKRNAPYLLSARIACGVCDKNLTHHSCGSKSPRYVCCSRRYKQGKPCLGGSITERHAEHLITEAVLTRWGEIALRALGAAGPRDVRAQWEAMNMETKRDLLKEALVRIELVPRKRVAYKGQRGQLHWRRLKVWWSEGWRLSPDEEPQLLEVETAQKRDCPRCGCRRDISMFLSHQLPDGWCRICRSHYDHPGSPKGKTWAEWRRERLLFLPPDQVVGRAQSPPQAAAPWWDPA